jgi:hypothetical protein
LEAKKCLISHDSLRCETPKIWSENEGKISEIKWRNRSETKIKRKKGEKSEKKAKKSGKKWKKRKNRLEFRFTLFRFKAKITKSKRSEKFKVKKSEKKQKNAKKCEKIAKKKWKSKKKWKKAKKIDLNFASLCFASKQKLLKWSEAKNLKRNKRKEAKKDKWNFIVK